MRIIGVILVLLSICTSQSLTTDVSGRHANGHDWLLIILYPATCNSISPASANLSYDSTLTQTIYDVPCRSDSSVETYWFKTDKDAIQFLNAMNPSHLVGLYHIDEAVALKVKEYKKMIKQPDIVETWKAYSR